MASTMSTDHWKRSRTLPDVVHSLRRLYEQTRPRVLDMTPAFERDPTWWMGPSHASPEHNRDVTTLSLYSQTSAALGMLDELRVAMVEPEQARALPEMETTMEYSAAAAELPLIFDPLYIDFGAPQGRMPLLVQPPFWQGDPIELVGAFCTRDDTYGLVLVPVQRVRGLLVPTFAVAITPPSGEKSGSVRAGYVVLDGEWRRCAQDPEDSQEGLGAQIRHGLICAERVVATLIFLLAPNVELAPIGLHGKAAKIAERKRQNIPLVVKVRRLSRPARPRPGATPRTFSHQFDVRGHYNHMTRGPVFDANPDKQVNVPEKGVCVRVWVPPHVKGPPDAIYIPKARVWESHEPKRDAA